MLSHKKTVGIIGGMGPLATADLFSKIIHMTDAACDQEHLHVIVDNNTAIPDRTRAILHNGTDPLPQLIASADRLFRSGADFLIMPCNTAHYFHRALNEAAKIPVLNMLGETAAFLKKRGISRVGLLATDGTIQSGVYERALKSYGIENIIPDAEGQKEVMHVIYDGIKAGNRSLDINAFKAVCQKLLTDGAQTLVLGCTELPLAFSMYEISLPNIDPTSVLAAAAIRRAGARCIGEYAAAEELSCAGSN